MDNPTANKSHLPCQSWAGQNGWSTASTQGPLLNPLSSSQHLSLGSSSDQRPPYDHMQASDQSCLSDLSTLSSRSNTHHSALTAACSWMTSKWTLKRDYNLQEDIKLRHGIRVRFLVHAMRQQIFIMNKQMELWQAPA
eukprot:superscaffoldBa00007261_g22365